MSTESIFYPIKKILLPVDGSEHSLMASKYAGEIAKKHGSKVTILYVMELRLPDAKYPIRFHELDSTTIEVEDEAIIKERAKKVMEKTKEILKSANVPIETEYISFGKVDRIIVETAEKEKFDLIIIGHRGLSGIKEVMLGSVAEGVCRNSPCPVLIVR